MIVTRLPRCCFQWFKDTNLKANHNLTLLLLLLVQVVSNGSKILIWKQITTNTSSINSSWSCFQWFKDTNLKANHNHLTVGPVDVGVVSNGSKILIWKQITTPCQWCRCSSRCFQWFKDTNLKANHNVFGTSSFTFMVVSNGSKILIWKQITTICRRSHTHPVLFPMVQRY